jgi:hypothetical protein
MISTSSGETSAGLRVPYVPIAILKVSYFNK